MAARKTAWGAGLIAACLGLAGCEEGAGGLFGERPEPSASAAAGPDGAFVERDVEAPGIFSTKEAGLWDGRPSLGGVWVAHPDVRDPERVLIRNESNGVEVIGALFRRERENPGPKLQVSSDAASALQMLAGAPNELSVVVLRREREEVAQPLEEATPVTPAETVEVAEAPLPAPEPKPTAEIAEAALAALEAEHTPDRPRLSADRISASLTSDAPAPEPAPAAAPAPTPKPVTSSLDKPFVQVGIFSVPENAEKASRQLRAQGVSPTVLDQDSNGRRFYRVIVGPAETRDGQRNMLEKVKSLGYSDAYLVRN